MKIPAQQEVKQMRDEVNGKKEKKEEKEEEKVSPGK